jgi:hypothetical protein
VGLAMVGRINQKKEGERHAKILYEKDRQILKRRPRLWLWLCKKYECRIFGAGPKLLYGNGSVYYLDLIIGYQDVYSFDIIERWPILDQELFETPLLESLISISDMFFLRGYLNTHSQIYKSG